jgi:hypothetical protein
MLAELRLEREQIEEAILTLERLARGRGRRRGRPPSWLKDAQNGTEEADAPAAASEPKKRLRPAAPPRAKHAVAAEA